MNISDQDLNIILQDTTNLRTDSIPLVIRQEADTMIVADTVPAAKSEIRHTFAGSLPVDTTSVCSRNHAADLIYSGDIGVMAQEFQTGKVFFPYNFIEKNRTRETQKAVSLMRSLKYGKELPGLPFHNDWIILIILVTGFVFSVINTFSRKFFPEVKKFFLFHGTGETPSRDIAGLFHWHSTLINLISFFSLALFAYCVLFYYGLLIRGVPGFINWLILFGIIVAAVTLRHITCYLTGNMSNQQDLFTEYIITIYLSYRFSALFLVFLVILLAYTRIFNPDFLIVTGFIIFSLMFLLRITRLFLIFLKRNISIFYLILYLCALEILPVLVLLKYFTGLF